MFFVAVGFVSDTVVMPLVKRKRKLMGGKAHSAGSKKRHDNARKEAEMMKPYAKKFMRENKKWSAPKMSDWLNQQGLARLGGKAFTPRVVKLHLQRLDFWG